MFDQSEKSTEIFPGCSRSGSPVNKDEADSLKQPRKYAARKKRSCRKRNMTYEEKKEENRRNSRNYLERNRGELDFYRAELGKKRMRLEKKCEDANDLFGPRTINRVKDTLGSCQIILQNLIEDENLKMNHELVERILQNYEVQKEEIRQMEWEKKEYESETEYNRLKKEFEDLLESKERYIVEKSRTNFASAKYRLNKRVLRAEMQRECFILQCAIENIEERMEHLKQCLTDVKTSIWNQILVRIDDYFSSTTFEKFDLDQTNWVIIREFYKSPVEVTSLSEVVEQFFQKIGAMPTTVYSETEDFEGIKYSAASQILKAAENMDSEWTSKRIPWEQLIGVTMPEADNEITISIAPTPSALPDPPTEISIAPTPSSLPDPPTEEKNKEAVEEVEEDKDKEEEEEEEEEEPNDSLFQLLNQSDQCSNLSISKDTTLRELLAISKIRQLPR